MNRIEQKHIKLALTPSLLSGAVGSLVSVALIVCAIVVSLGKSGRLKNDLFAVSYFRSGLNGHYHSIAHSLDSNNFVSELGLWLFWIVIGLIAYAFAINLFKVVMSFAYFKKSLHYVHAKPHQMIKELLLHTGLRLVAFIAGWILIHICFKNILPYCLAVISSVSKHWSIIGEVKLVLIMLTLLILWHLLTLIVRLLTLKPRVFGYSL
jgi:hypothetical protein